ncbi:phage portal protein [Tautonia marina]|uniref:phage portal protein n=1 Tax=Tautonia marina TaxID=2653855 RepID=UPI0012610109|nr:phage portal protein [Tautonia marina]
MVWPFRRKDVAPPPGRKNATYFFSLGLGKAGLTGAGYDKLASEGYAQCVVAYACINLKATAVASVDLQLYRRGKKGKLAKVEAHELLRLLENPNPTQSGREFMRHLTSYQQLCGNAYIFGNGIDPAKRTGKPPRELQLLNPGKMRIEPGTGLFPKQYEYRSAQNVATTFPVEQITGRSAILHLKSFNPLNAWYGMSPLEAAALGVDIHNDGQRWNKRLIENGARPSGALVVKGGEGHPATLSDDQYLRVKQMIDEQFSGPANAGRPMLLEGGLEWKEMSLNPKDMEFLEGKHSAARDIALAYGVPPQLLGIPGDSTYSNYSEARTAFWTDTVLPELGWTLDALNRWLTPLYGEDLYVWYDEEMIPALETRRKEKAERINAASYMTINEKRRAMGLDDVEGGDVIFVPSTNVPLELAGQIDLPEPGSQADQGGEPATDAPEDDTDDPEDDEAE